MPRLKESIAHGIIGNLSFLNWKTGCCEFLPLTLNATVEESMAICGIMAICGPQIERYTCCLGRQR
jgi:hypothetical protein